MEESLNQIIHFCHIPKCGGTSFRKGVEEAYGDEALSFYDNNPLHHRLRDKFLYIYGRCKRVFFQEKSLGKYKMVYGHFCLDDLYIPIGTSIKRGAFFRDPIEWVGSYYFYIRHKYPDEIPDDPIALIHKLKLYNGFRIYLGRYEVDDLDYVGLTEEYAESLQLYEKVFNKTIPHVHENKTSSAPTNYREYFVNQGLIEAIENLMQDNQIIYAQALEKYARLKKKYLL